MTDAAPSTPKPQLKLSAADYALLAMALGKRPLSPYRCDQDTLFRLWDRDLIDVSWADDAIRVTDKGREAWADRPKTLKKEA